MKNKMGKTIVWAVDPLDPETKPSAQAVRELSRWAKESGLSLQPLYVMPLPIDSIQRGSLDAVDEMQNLLDEYVEEYGIAGVLPPALVLDDGGTRHGAVRELLAFAKKSGAAAIALSSHGRAGLKRFVLGSFAEQILKDAPVPVMFLSKDQPAKKGTALFATDFSSSSRKVFGKFLKFAQPLGLDVVIFHAISLPAPVYTSAGVTGPSAFIPDNYFFDEEARARKESVAWIREAKEAGVKARLQLSEPGIGLLTGEKILEAADSAKASLIALGTESRPLEHFVFGSAAMDVFRGNRFPVWICGPGVFKPAALKGAKKMLRTKPRGRKAAGSPDLRKNG